MSKHRKQDVRGLSPVIGIILILAVTVLLGATAAAYIVGLSDQTAGGAPTAAFSFETEQKSGGQEAVTIEHKTGESIDPDNLYVVVSGAECTSGSGDPDGRFNVADDFGFSQDQMSASMTIQYGRDLDLDGSLELCSGGTLDVSGATFRIVWESPAHTSRELQTWIAS